MCHCLLKVILFLFPLCTVSVVDKESGMVPKNIFGKNQDIDVTDFKEIPNELVEHCDEKVQPLGVLVIGIVLNI